MITGASVPFWNGATVIDLVVCVGVPVAFGVFVYLIDRKTNRDWWERKSDNNFRPPVGRDINGALRDEPDYMKDMIHSYRVAVSLGDTKRAEELQDYFELIGEWPLKEEV